MKNKADKKIVEKMENEISDFMARFGVEEVQFGKKHSLKVKQPKK